MTLEQNNEIVNNDDLLDSPFDQKEENQEENKQSDDTNKPLEKELDDLPYIYVDGKLVYKAQLKLNADLKLFQKKYYLINRSGTAQVVFNDDKLGLQFMNIEAFISLNRQYHYYIPTIESPDKLRKVYLTYEFLESDKTGRYQGIIFDPSKSGMCEYLNLWKGWTVKRRIGDVKPFLDLINSLCNFDPVSIGYLLDYLAHMVQKPWQLPGKCIVLKGPQGTGKGSLMKILGKLAKHNYIHLTDPQLLTGQFSGHLMSCYILFADEVVWGGDKVAENMLKGMITESTTMTNEKHKNAVMTGNYKRIFMASNNERPVAISEGDRRYFVLEVSDIYKEQTAKGQFFYELDEWINNDGVECVFDYLLRRDISNFNPFIEQPKTRAWTELMKLNFDPTFKFIYGVLNGDISISDNTERKIDNSLIWVRNSLYNDFVLYVKQNNIQYIPVSDSFSKAMTNCFKFADDEPKWRTNWKNKGDYYYKIPSRKECQRRFAENHMKANPSYVFFDYDEVESTSKPVESTPKPVKVSSPGVAAPKPIIESKPAITKTLKPFEPVKSVNRVVPANSKPKSILNVDMAIDEDDPFSDKYVKQ